MERFRFYFHILGQIDCLGHQFTSIVPGSTSVLAKVSSGRRNEIPQNNGDQTGPLEMSAD